MKKRRLGKTGLEVSEVGYGTWQLGSSEFWGTIEDKEAHALVHCALDLGCNLFDTAPNYTDTHSERLLGEALKGRRDEVVLVSKFGHVPGGGTDYSEEWMWQSLHDSLERLQTDYLDVFMLHSPHPEFRDGSHPIWDAVRKARDQGKIRFYGASLDWSDEIFQCLETSDAQVLEVLFNILHQDARRTFDLVREKDVGILTKVPLDSGWLSGKYNAQSTFTGVRDRWTPEQIRQRAELIDQLAWLTEDGTPLPQKALAYLLSYPEVGCVIPGARSIRQLETNMGASGSQLTMSERSRLETFWNEHTNNGTNLLPW
ncbi:putative oxidoreductase [Pontiella desulfatans]|uniref:Putative oxidoreductase n=1 Tax=Pontiella desulfatans TaxID=2750659 RepID=A0A6C2TYY8_PONDE|nr:aldo/keto reductase [Pontiella desulfatans]VGO12571.1 putative oxidoreductase [Pontiella desulfatans]